MVSCVCIQGLERARALDLVVLSGAGTRKGQPSILYVKYERQNSQLLAILLYFL